MLLAMLGIAGCNDEPSPVGSGYLPETVSFSTYVVGASELEIISGAARISNATSQGSSTVLVGLAPDNTVAHGLLAITEPIKALEGPNPRSVDKVSLRMRTLPYRYGDLSGRQSTFDIVVLEEIALDTIRYNEALASRIAAAPSLGTYTGTLPDSAVVTVDLDRDASLRFLREYYAYDTTITTTAGRADTIITIETRKTLGLRGRNGSTVIASFLGATSADVPDTLLPALLVRMGDSTATLGFGVSSWVGDLPVETGPGRIVVAGGEPIRTFIQVTPNALPVGATIHQARLVLHVDADASKRGTTEANSYITLSEADAEARTSFLPRGGGRLLGGFRRSADSTSFTNIFEIDALAPSITSAVRSRRAGGSAVAPFVLALGRGSNGRADQESGTVDRLVFHGLDAADTTLRPTLIIIYSTQADAP